MSILDAHQFDTIGKARSFSWSNIATRALWNLSWFCLARWTPPQLHAWRVFLLRRFGAKIGKGVRVYGSAKIWLPSNLEMGDYSVIGPKTNCYCMAKVTLEERAEVAWAVTLCCGSHDIDDPKFQLFAKPITIKKHAWIAACAFVGPGVVVNEGAVLGGAAVTFRDLLPWSVYSGNPAVKIRDRKKGRD